MKQGTGTPGKEVPARPMGKTKSRAGKQNVIPLHLDAAFYSERALRSLDRFRYEKALRYFRRATELEPDNPANHCNMAGILSEMGEFEQSNAILLKIVTEIDPGMTECYFYMANNYANMENYEAAETALAQYMEKDPEGTYIAEAEEMMELLGFELNRPARAGAPEGADVWFEHDQARAMLESGRFAEAAEMLERIVGKRPDLLAARNNLALAYFYMGEYEKSLGQIRTVLRNDPGNLHARCNLAIFCRHFGYKAELDTLVEGLKKLVPYHPEHVFKVAATLGMLEEHEAAYRLFVRLLKEGIGAGDPAFCHYAAAAAAGSGRRAEALRWWRRAAKLDGRGSVAAFWLEQWSRAERTAGGGASGEDGGSGKTGRSGEGGGQGEWDRMPSYYYLLPFEEQLRIAELAGESFAGAADRDPQIAASLVWALERGNAEEKRKAVLAAGRLTEEGFFRRQLEAKGGALPAPAEEAADESTAGATGDRPDRPGPADVERALAAVAANPSERRDVRLLARRALNGPPASEAGGLPRWDRRWQAVMDAALAGMDRGSLIQRHDLQALWIHFLNRTYPDVPRITKVEGWAAALVYLTAKMHRRAVTLREVSRRYGVSARTVGRHARAIDRTCGLKEKMRRLDRLEDPFRHRAPADQGPADEAPDSAAPYQLREE